MGPVKNGVVKTVSRSNAKTANKTNNGYISKPTMDKATKVPSTAMEEALRGCSHRGGTPPRPVQTRAAPIASRAEVGSSISRENNTSDVIVMQHVSQTQGEQPAVQRDALAHIMDMFSSIQQGQQTIKSSIQNVYDEIAAQEVRLMQRIEEKLSVTTDDIKIQVETVRSDLQSQINKLESANNASNSAIDMCDIVIKNIEESENENCE
ncbi:unnamed protein product, partial [Owenia fusiformis]